MTREREPYVKEADLCLIRPTQFCVGYSEVEAKQRSWKEKGKEEHKVILSTVVIPVVKGPDKLYYALDHHHEGRALLLEGQTTVLVHAQADLSKLPVGEFWVHMVMFGWCYLFDAKGHLRHWQDLPTNFLELTDDPYRSLAGALRKAGGYAKSVLPFSEFQWAAYLRSRVKDPSDLDKAMKVARARGASFLPGWVSTPKPKK